MAVGRKKSEAALKRDGGECVIRLDGCTIIAEVADHRANRKNGGAKSLDEFSNLIAACSLCNGKKETVHGEILDLLIARGVRVISDSTHAKTAVRARETPVWYPNGERWYLDDEGRRHAVPA